jgi:hypothetical protein
MRWGYYAVRLVIVLVLLAAAGFLPSDRGPADRYRYREGDIARDRIVAPYDFRVEKDETSLRREQELAAASVAPVFAIDGRVSSDMLNRFALFEEKVLAVVMDPKTGPDERAEDLRTLGVPLSTDAAGALAAAGRARRVLDDLGAGCTRSTTPAS